MPTVPIALNLTIDNHRCRLGWSAFSDSRCETSTIVDSVNSHTMYRVGYDDSRK
jgi:hypothetical protein